MYDKKNLTTQEAKTMQTRLKELRVSKGFTQEQMASVLVKRVADYFGVDVNYVVGGENSSRELSEYFRRKIRSCKRLTQQEHLDVSDLSTMDKIMIIEFCEYLRTRREFAEGRGE